MYHPYAQTTPARKSSRTVSVSTPSYITSLRASGFTRRSAARTSQGPHTAGNSTQADTPANGVDDILEFLDRSVNRAGADDSGDEEGTMSLDSGSPATSRYRSSFNSPMRSSGRFSMSGRSDIVNSELEADLRTIKAEKRKLADENLKLQRQIVDMERKDSEIDLQRQKDRMMLESSQKDRENLRKQKEQLEMRLGSLQNVNNEAKTASDTKVVELKRANQALRDEYASFQQAANSRLEEGAQRISELMAEKAALVERHAKELRHAETRVRAEQRKYEDLEAKFREAERIIQELRANPQDPDLPILRRQMSEQDTHIRKLDEKVKRLTQENQYYYTKQLDFEKLQEEKMAADRQLSHMNQLRSRLGAMEIELLTLRAEKDRWAKFLEERDDSGLESPYALSKTLAKQRLENSVLKDRIGEEVTRRNAREGHVARLESELKQMAEKLNEMEAQKERDLKTVKRLERGKDLSHREVEFLREQLRSYEFEDAALGVASDTTKPEQLVKLEVLLEDYKTRVGELEQQLEASGSLRAAAGPASHTADDIADIRTQILQRDDAIKALEAEKDLLQKEVDSLDRQVTELLGALGRGEYNPETTTILQLANNPESQEYAIRESTLNALRAENDSLRKLLRGGEAAGGVQLVPAEAYRVVEVDRINLKNALGEKDKRLLRLKEVLNGKVQEYLAAVYSLLGYKLEIERDGRVRLTSTFVSPEQLSIYCSSAEQDKGTIEVRGSAKPELQQGFEYFITKHDCVPAFLGWISQELWKRTRMPAGR
ncbi:coiled-coil domain-containing protein mad1 [Rhizophlyctis rosea]|nr:coiled-coil domain-containing protein mad1 [Rhizophlyctis rosea]